MSMEIKTSGRKKRYKSLLDNLQKSRNDSLNGYSIKDLQDLQRSIIDNDVIHHEASESINELLKNNAEILLDAQVLKGLHEEVSNVFKCNTDFNDTMYIEAIRDLACMEEFVGNWSIITKVALKMVRTTAMKTSMYGAVDIEWKVSNIKERRKRSVMQLSEERRPDVLQEGTNDKPGADSTNVALEQITAIFKANNFQPIPFYKLIIHPKSFTSTVQNAFQLSFLIRDGNLALDMGEDSKPEVHYVSPTDGEQNFTSSQAICSLSEEICDEMVKFYNIKEAMLELPLDVNLTNTILSS